MQTSVCEMKINISLNLPYQISCCCHSDVGLCYFAILSGLYSGGFDIEYPVNVGDWAIVIDAFVCHLKFCHMQNFFMFI